MEGQTYKGLVDQIKDGSSLTKHTTSLKDTMDREIEMYHARARLRHEEREDLNLAGMEKVRQDILGFEDLAGEISAKLEEKFSEFGIKVEQAKAYTLKEKFAQLFGKKTKAWAERHRRDRIMASGFKESMATINNMGDSLLQALSEVVEVHTGKLELLVNDRKGITQEFQQAEEQYRVWTNQRSDYEGQLKGIDSQLETATATERAEMQPQRDAIEEKYRHAKSLESQFLAVMNRDEKDKPYLDQFIENLYEGIEAVEVIARNTQAKLGHFRNALLTAESLLLGAQKVEGASVYNKAHDETLGKLVRVATDYAETAMAERDMHLVKEQMTVKEFEEMLANFATQRERSAAVKKQLHDDVYHSSPLKG